jgi:putative glutamine amidotransferase
MRSPRIEGLRRRGLAVSERIVEAVFRAGGEPVVFCAMDGSDVPQRLWLFDGLLIPGGRDVDPSRYAADDAHESVDDPDPAQDEADLVVAAASVEIGIPTLAICRGMQVLNVALGGTLVQHLPPSAVDHRDSFHDVTLERGCEVALAMGAEVVSVSSYHHQALDRLGDGLRAVGASADGCVEVVAHERGNVLAVQWHPEDDAYDVPAQQALFDCLVRDARHRAQWERLATST